MENHASSPIRSNRGKQRNNDNQKNHFLSKKNLLPRPNPSDKLHHELVSHLGKSSGRVARVNELEVNGRGSARHRVVSSDSRSPPDSTDGTSKGHRDGEWKGGGGDATPEIEEARGRTRSRAWWSETEAAAGRAAALTASVSVLRYTSGYPLRDTRGEGGMQRENTRHTRKRRRRRSAGGCPRREARQPCLSIPTSPEKK